MNGHWTVRKVTNLLTRTRWVVYASDGSWAGAYATWREAFNAASIVADVEAWLKSVSQLPANKESDDRKWAP